MATYKSTHKGAQIDSAVDKVINNLAGIQGVKVNNTALTPDTENKVNIDTSTFNIPAVVQATGTSTVSVMSQNAVTTAINGINIPTVVQQTGTSLTEVMSQNAVSNELGDKQDKLVMSNIIYIDGAIGNDSNSGTIASPVKTLHGAVTLAGTLTTATGFEFHMAQGTYTETADVTLPNLPMIIYGNGSILSASGYTVTIPNPNFIRYNLFTTANVVYNNFATGARCIIQGGGITGNITVNSYVEMTMCQLNSGTITVGTTGQLLVTYCSPTSVFTSTGVLILNKVNINTGKTSYLVTSTAGQLTVTDCILYNSSTGGAIHCENGATTLANIISNNYITAASGNTLLSGTAYTVYNKNYIVGTAPSGTYLIGVNTDILGAGTIPQLGSDATGDIYYRNASGILEKLGVGTSGTLLNSSGTLPQWSSASTLGLPTLSANNVFTGNNSGILKSYTTTLPYASWTGTSAPYTKAVTVTGILATDKPSIDLDLSSATYANVATIQSSWANVYRGVTSADTITFYASTVPTIDIPLELKVVR